MVKMDCDFNNDHDWYLFIMHLDVVLTAPIFLFALFCLLFRSPKAMSNHRWHLLNNVVWSYSQEISWATLSTPVMFCGIHGGYPAGLVELPFSTAVQTGFCALLFGEASISLVQLFAVRYHTLLRDSDAICSKRVTKTAFVLAYTAMILLVIGIIQTLSDNDHIALKNRLSQECTDVIGPWLWSEKAFVWEFRIDTFIIILILAGIEVLGASMIYLWTILCFKYFNGLHIMSKHTIRLQKEYLKGLLALNFASNTNCIITIYVAGFIAPVISSCTPFANGKKVFAHSGILVPPLATLTATYVTSYCRPVITNICFMMLSYHSSCGILVMIVVNKPYRDVMLKSLSKVGICSPKKTKVVNVSSSSAFRHS